MSEITVIALDAMGGDNAPGEMVKGAVDALGREQDIKVYLLGKEDIVNAELQMQLDSGKSMMRYLPP